MVHTGQLHVTSDSVNTVSLTVMRRFETFQLVHEIF